MGQIIRQSAGQFPRRLVSRTERKGSVTVADPDRTMLIQPVLLGRRQISICICIIVAPFRYPVSEVRILVPDSGQCHIQFGKQVRPVFIDGIVIIRRAHSGHGNDFLLGTKGENSCISVEFAGGKHSQRFRFLNIQRNDFDREMISFNPIPEEPLLNAFGIHAYPFPVEGFGIVGRDLPVFRIDIDIIGFRSHGKIGEGHVCFPLRLIRYVAQQVDLTVFEHLEQVRPAVLHILISPARVSGNLFLIFDVNTASSSEFIPIAK